MKFAWLLLIIALPAIAAPLPVAVDSAMRDEMRQQQLVGLAVGVIRNGRVAFTQGYGWADREKKVPVTQATLFRWASISKSLTAVTALQLWERNRLNLEADVRLYVPEFPAKPEPISAQHLLCNQGGIVHYSNGPIVVTLRRYEHPNPFKNVVRALDTFKHSPVINPPGEK